MEGGGCKCNGGNGLGKKVTNLSVAPYPSDLLVMLIVSENYQLLSSLMVSKFLSINHLRRIVTYGILGVWTLALGPIIIF